MSPARHATIRVIDSHTAGEPTRLVMEGGPELGDGPLAERLRRFREHYDHYRRAIVNEPRGSDTLVGALLCKPHRPDCQVGVIFFNNVGYPRHVRPRHDRARGLARRRGPVRAGADPHRHAGGPVDARLHEDGRYRRGERRELSPGPGCRRSRSPAREVRGDVAWGGNWFFLTHAENPVRSLSDNLESLTGLACAPAPRRQRAGLSPGRSRGDLRAAGTRRRAAAAISCSVPAAPTTAHPAAPARARSSPAWRPTASSRRARPGCRRA